MCEAFNKVYVKKQLQRIYAHNMHLCLELFMVFFHRYVRIHALKKCQPHHKSKLGGLICNGSRGKTTDKSLVGFCAVLSGRLFS